MSAKFEYIPLDRRIAHQKEVKAKRREWLERAHRRNPRCHYCRNVTELKDRAYNQRCDHINEFIATLDHAIPRSRGGRDEPSNYRLACAICNTLKADMHEEEFRAELEDAGVR